MQVSGRIHAPAALLPGKSHGIHWIRGWVGLSAGMYVLEMRTTFAPTRIRTADRPACSAVALLTITYIIIEALLLMELPKLCIFNVHSKFGTSNLPLCNDSVADV
jgi:hypothetical protein